VEFFWFWDVIDVSWISDGVVSKVWIVDVVLIFFVYFVTTPKSVVCEFVPVDSSFVLVEFNWMCPISFGIIIPGVYCGSSCEVTPC
jgi:hypothetical protein